MLQNIYQKFKDVIPKLFIPLTTLTYKDIVCRWSFDRYWDMATFLNHKRNLFSSKQLHLYILLNPNKIAYHCKKLVIQRKQFRNRLQLRFAIRSRCESQYTKVQCEMYVLALVFDFFFNSYPNKKGNRNHLSEIHRNNFNNLF